jgi:hypothetical protein
MELQNMLKRSDLVFEKSQIEEIFRLIATLKGSKERSFNFIPLTFEGLLDYLFQKQSRQDCWGAIGKVDRFKFDEHNNVLPSSSY